MPIIIHLDFDSYFASAERSQNKSLKGKPLVISSGGVRAIVAAASYEARKLGVKAAMPLYRAKEIIPDLLVAKANFDLYISLSTRVFEYIFESYTNKVQVGSIDECYIDITDLVSKQLTPKMLAHKIQNDILKEFDIPVSIGISENKFVAKMATSINKPFGVTELPSKDFLKTCGDWKLSDFFGIGKATESKLNEHGIMDIKQLAEADVDLVKRIVGVVGPDLVWKASGGGETELTFERNELKGIGNEITFKEGDISDRKEILEVLDSLIVQVAQRMKNRNMLGYVITVLFKVSGGVEISRTMQQKTLKRPIGTYAEIKKEAIVLFDELWEEQTLKFVGVRMSSLVDKYSITYQSSIFDNETKKTKSSEILDQLNSKFGKKVVVSGQELMMQEHKKQNQSRYIENDKIIKHFDVKD